MKTTVEKNVKLVRPLLFFAFAVISLSAYQSDSSSAMTFDHRIMDYFSQDNDLTDDCNITENISIIISCNFAFNFSMIEDSYEKFDNPICFSRNSSKIFEIDRKDLDSAIGQDKIGQDNNLRLIIAFEKNGEILFKKYMPNKTVDMTSDKLNITENNDHCIIEGIEKIMFKDEDNLIEFYREIPKQQGNLEFYAYTLNEGNVTCYRKKIDNETMKKLLGCIQDNNLDNTKTAEDMSDNRNYVKSTSGKNNSKTNYTEKYGNELNSTTAIDFLNISDIPGSQNSTIPISQAGSENNSAYSTHSRYPEKNTYTQNISIDDGATDMNSGRSVRVYVMSIAIAGTLSAAIAAFLTRH